MNLKSFKRCQLLLQLCWVGWLFFISVSTVILFFFPPTFPHKELLAPQQVFAKLEGMDKLMVMWTPPEKAAAAVQKYVVEWRELHPGGGMQPPLGWLWSPPYRLSALISGT